MQEILTGKFAPLPSVLWPPKSLRIVDWNINRGLQLQGITDFLASANADVLILQEVDVNARRTHRLNIAEEIARYLPGQHNTGVNVGGIAFALPASRPRGRVRDDREERDDPGARQNRRMLR